MTPKQLNDYTSIEVWNAQGHPFDLYDELNFVIRFKTSYNH